MHILDTCKCFRTISCAPSNMLQEYSRKVIITNGTSPHLPHTAEVPWAGEVFLILK